MKMLMTRLAGVAVAGMVAQASIAGVVHKSIADLATESDRIVIGDVTAVEYHWNQAHTHIYSRVSVRVTDRILGQAGDEISLSIMGGTIGELSLVTSVDPRFEVNDHVLLFLHGEESRITGSYQGALLTDGVDVMRTDTSYTKRIETTTRVPLNSVLDEVARVRPEVGQVNVQPYHGDFSLEAAQRYVLNGRDWTYMPNPMGEPYKINPNCADAGAGTTAQEVAAIKAAADSWNAAGARFAFTYGGTTNSTSDALDQQNNIFFKNTSGMDSSTIAVCQSWIQGNDIIEWDIIFNDFHHTFWSGVGGCSGQKDIQSVAAHELGHSLGLGHSAVSAATMFATTSNCNIDPRSLHSDDIAGIRAIYGATGIFYVDFLFNGASDGTINAPFSTLQAGLNAAGPGQIIRIKPGISSETFPNGINQHVIIEANTTPVTIGQQ